MREYISREGAPEVVRASDGSYSVVVPIAVRRRGARKAVTLPNGQGWAPQPWNDAPTPLQRALARGCRWQAMLEAGEVDSVTALAKREGIERATMSRCLTLATLAPEIVAAIFDETLSDDITLMELATGTPMLWEEQRNRFLHRKRARR